MHPYELKKGIYWVGALDWNARSFHGYTTNRGITYNAYLIVDEKIALIDTAKATFTQEFIDRVSKIVDIADIDYIVANHVEPDHSGSIPYIMARNKKATIVTSTPQGVKGLTAYYGQYPYMGVKGGDSLSLGKHTLQFVPTPMLHWPDNMVTYCPEAKILFSNDAFGQHFASSERFDEEGLLCEIMQEAKKYYANIVMPYGGQAKGAVEIVSTLDMELIAPSHGIIWRNHIPDILAAYKKWSSNVPDEKAIVVFDSMWHSTETMATTIAEAFASKNISTQLVDLKATHISDIMTMVLDAKYICVGSPTLNNNMLPNVAAFLTYMKGLAPKGRKAMAFGSYGWGGQSIALVEEQLIASGFTIFMDKVRINYRPSEVDLESLTRAVLAAV